MKRAGRTRDEPLVERAGKSVAEFCYAYGISRSTFNNYQKRGVGPAMTQPVPGGRVIITPEAEHAWKACHTALAAERQAG